MSIQCLLPTHMHTSRVNTTLKLHLPRAIPDIVNKIDSSNCVGMYVSLSLI